MTGSNKKMVTALPLTLTRAREKVLAPFRGLLIKYGITEPQWRVLRTIGTAGPIELAQLAHVTALLFPSLSRIIRDLEERNLITRIAHESDMRRFLVELSPIGRQLFDAIAPDCEEVYATIRAAIGAEKLKQLHLLLTELEHKLEEAEFREFDAPSAELAELIGGVQKRGRPRAVSE